MGPAVVGGAVSGARHELLTTGTLGPDGVALLYRTVRQVVRLRNLPPPPGTFVWTPDVLDEAAHEVLATRKGVGRLITLATNSTDEDSFRRQLWQLVANDLASAGRRTERGKLAERIKDVLEHVPELVDSTSRLSLRGAEPELPEPRYDELVAAAASVPVVVPAWDPLSSHHPPIADRNSLVTMIRTVLAIAPGGLPFAILIDVLAARLGVHDAPVQAEHTVLDMVAPAAPDDPAATAGDRDAARRLFGALTTAQQLVLPYLEESATVIADHTGLGRTKAWRTAAETRPRVQSLLTDDPHAAATLREAVELARQRWGLR